MADHGKTPSSRESLDTWVRSSLPHALAYAVSLLRQRDSAEDIVHDCYCRLLQKSDVYDLPRDGLKLLIRSITNACIDRKAREWVLLSLDTLADSEDSGSSNPLMDGRAEQPVERVLARELEQALEEGLARLPMVQRAALQMKTMGHSLQEVAEALGISATNAGVLTHRARQALTKYLAPFLS